MWKEYVPVAFHVDYWDYIGWKDKFADSKFSTRQRMYAKEWNASSVYTPGVVLNGREWKGWQRYQSIPKLVSQKVGYLSVEGNKEMMRLQFEPSDEYRVVSAWTAHIALLGMEVKSQIRSGENSGKQIEHNFLVLDYQTHSMDLNAGTSVTNFKLNEKSKNIAKKMAVAAWVTQEGSSEPIQVLGKYL